LRRNVVPVVPPCHYPRHDDERGRDDDMLARDVDEMLMPRRKRSVGVEIIVGEREALAVMIQVVIEIIDTTVIMMIPTPRKSPTIVKPKRNVFWHGLRNLMRLNVPNVLRRIQGITRMDKQ
jgi:hypothetical protein